MNKPWTNNKLNRKQNQIKRLRKSVKNHPYKEDIFRRANAEFKEEIGNARREYEQKLISDKDSNKIYKHMKAVRGNNNASVKCLKSNGEIIKDKKLIADELNVNYAAVFAKSEIPSTVWLLAEKRLEGPSLTRTEYHPKDVKSVLKGLKTKSAPGNDGILPIMLKAAANELCDPLSAYFTHTQATQEIHDRLKKPFWRLFLSQEIGRRQEII